MPCWPAIGADVAEQEIIGEEFLEEEEVVEDEIEDLGWPYSPKASWTGRIAETETAWTSGGSATRRAYRYDGMGRLRSATTRTDIDWPLQPWNGEGLPEYEYLTDEHYTYDRNGNISSLERLNGTEYAAISMTRTGNRLTTADVSEWDGDVDSPRYYRGSFVYKDVSISVPTGCLQTR